MSAYEDEWICPKCRHYSTNADSCIHCGALISKILERENQRGFGDGSTEDKSAALTAHEVPRAPISFTAIVLVLVLIALAALVYYYQAGGFDSEPAVSALQLSANLVTTPV